MDDSPLLHIFAGSAINLTSPSNLHDNGADDLTDLVSGPERDTRGVKKQQGTVRDN